jgi:hypothetical protein
MPALVAGRPGDPPRHQGRLADAIDRRDNGGVMVNVFYNHSWVTKYLKVGGRCESRLSSRAPHDLHIVDTRPPSTRCLFKW